jgi:FkbM family methyltransferase
LSINYHLGRLAGWPLERLMRMRRFPLLRTFGLRTSWLYDMCRIAGTRDFRMLFDVGANVGQTAGAMAGFFPGAAVHSFEPMNETFLTLSANARRWPNVRAHKLAMGRRSESREVEVQENSELNSLAPATAGSARPARTERVEITTLDGFCAKQGIEAMDALKTDAQGGDLDVLAGGDSLLSNERVAFVYAEVSFQPDDRVNTHFAGVNEFLLARKFRLFGFYEQFGGTHGGRGYLQFCNALYVHPGALRRRFRRPEPAASA